MIHTFEIHAPHSSHYLCWNHPQHQSRTWVWAASRYIPTTALTTSAMTWYTSYNNYHIEEEKKHFSGLAHFNRAGQHDSSERWPLLPSQSFGYICNLILPNPSNKFGLTPPKPHFPTGTSLSIIDNNDCTCQLVNDCVVTGWGKNAFSATYFNSQLKKVQIIVVSGLLIESFVNKSNSTNSL